MSADLPVVTAVDCATAAVASFQAATDDTRIGNVETARSHLEIGHGYRLLAEAIARGPQGAFTRRPARTEDR